MCRALFSELNILQGYVYTNHVAYVDYERVCGTEVWEKHLSICHGIVEFGRNALFNDVVRPNAGVTWHFENPLQCVFIWVHFYY